MSHGGGKKVVLAALAANGGIATVKLVVAAISGSATMLAEGVHSTADTANQALLLVGMTLAAKREPSRYPLGRDAERYFWAFVVSLTLFLLGGVFAIFEGVHKLRGPDEGPPHTLWVPLVVLGVSLALELGSFTVALREFQRERRGRPFFQALFAAKDPTIPVVLLEDSGAVLGLFVAFVALVVSLLTHSAVPDAVGSIVIGLLLCGIGFLLAVDTHSLLIGEGASPEVRARALRAAEETAGVDAVTQLLSMQLGPESILLALKVRFRAGMGLSDVERTIDALEANVRATIPEMKRIFVEPDSDYVEALDPERQPLTTSP
ncbi:MAG TPA: cation diffusion facilitator family transporter [Polyangiaceae bacterium]|nr:cation diffusion facilitator family transporter [Polyangiaceae bacterium]